MIYRNVVIGTPLVDAKSLLSDGTDSDWEFENSTTLYTNELFLPKILVEAGIAKSNTEVRKNRPDLFRSLDKIDCEEIKWGKKRLYIIRGDVE